MGFRKPTQKLSALLFLQLLAGTAWAGTCSDAFLADPAIEARIQALQKPFDPAKLLDQPETDLRSLLVILLRIRRGEPAWDDFRNWIRTPEHAVVAYSQINEMPVETRSALMTSLLASDPVKNPQSSIWRIRGNRPRLVTFGLEKESASDALYRMYRPQEIPEAIWLNLPLHERWVRLRRAIYVLKQIRKGYLPINEGGIAPTPLKLRELGIVESAAETGFFLEVKTWLPELDVYRVTGLITKLSELTQEPGAFHTHTVFEISAQDPQFNRILLWVKQMNDYYGLTYLEDRQLPVSNIDILPFYKIEREIVGQGTPEQFLEKFLKLYHFGLRSGIYGPAIHPEDIRIGIETRDPTPEPQEYQALLERQGQVLSTESWRQIAWEDFQPGTYRGLLQDKGDTFIRALEQAGLGKLEKLNTLFLGLLPPGPLEARFGLPFVPFETGTYADYRTGRVFKPNQDVRKRLVKARKRYIDQLTAIDSWLKSLTLNHHGRLHDHHREELKRRLWEALFQWARDARPSELYRDF